MHVLQFYMLMKFLFVLVEQTVLGHLFWGVYLQNKTHIYITLNLYSLTF